MSSRLDTKGETGVLPPCEVTGKACEWLSEEWYDENGDMVSWDNYCVNCYTWRDWHKDTYPDAGE